MVLKLKSQSNRTRETGYVGFNLSEWKLASKVMAARAVLYYSVQKRILAPNKKDTAASVAEVHVLRMKI